MTLLADIFKNVLSNSKATKVKDEKRKNVPTSIRLNDEAYSYYVAQAEALNIAPSQLINMVLHFFYEQEREIASDHIKTLISEMERRVLRVFAVHGLVANDIQSFVNHVHVKYGRPILKTHELHPLADILNDEMLQEIGDFFCVSPKWLRGDYENILDENDKMKWYKSARKSWNEEITTVLKNKPRGYPMEVNFFISNEYAVNIAYLGKNDPRNQLYGGVIVQYPKLLPNGKVVNVRKTTTLGQWDYVRTRRHLKQLALFCNHLGYFKNDIFTRGYKLPEQTVQDLNSGRILAMEVTLQEGWPIQNYISFTNPIFYEKDEAEAILEDYVEDKLYAPMLELGLVTESQFESLPMQVDISKDDVNKVIL